MESKNFKIIKRGRGRVLLHNVWQFYKSCVYKNNTCYWRCKEYKSVINCKGYFTISITYFISIIFLLWHLIIKAVLFSIDNYIYKFVNLNTFLFCIWFSVLDRDTKGDDHTCIPDTTQNDNDIIINKVSQGRESAPSVYKRSLLIIMKKGYNRFSTRKDKILYYLSKPESQNRILKSYMSLKICDETVIANI